MIPNKLKERIEDAKSTLTDFNNYHINQIEFIDKIRKEIEDNRKPDNKIPKELSENLDEMSMRIQSGLYNYADGLMSELNLMIKIVERNDNFIKIFMIMKEITTMDENTPEIVKFQKIKELLTKIKEDTEDGKLNKY